MEMIKNTRKMLALSFGPAYRAELNKVASRASRGDDVSDDVRQISQKKYFWAVVGSLPNGRLPEQGAVERDVLKAVQEGRAERLVQLSASNIADMPSEVRKVARSNMLDAYVLLGGREPSHANQQQLYAEEDRVRNLVMQRQADLAAEKQAQARAAHMNMMQEQILARCNIDAAIVGASVSSPYRRGRTILGAALQGAIEQTIAEERVRRACLNAAGL